MIVSQRPPVEVNMLGNGGQGMKTSTRTIFDYAMLAILAVLAIAMLF